MNDDELTSILRRGEAHVGLPADFAGRVQADMHHELDRTLGHDAAVLPLQFSATPPTRRKRPLIQVAAALLLIGAAGLLLSRRDAVVDETTPAQEVPRSTQQPYLVACLDFIESTTIDDEPWKDVLTNPAAIQTGYTATLATSIDQLLAANPAAGIATPELRAASIEARSADPDLELIVQQLESVQDTLHDETGIECLTATDRHLESD